MAGKGGVIDRHSRRGRTNVELLSPVPSETVGERHFITL